MFEVDIVAFEVGKDLEEVVVSPTVAVVEESKSSGGGI